MSLYTKLAEVEGKIAAVEERLGLPQRRYLLVRHSTLNTTTRLVEITDTLILPRPYAVNISPRFANLQVSIEGADSIYLSVNDLQVEIPRTFTKSLFLPSAPTRAIFILEPPVNNNQVVYSNPTTKEINGVKPYKLLALMENDPTLWKIILRRESDSKKTT
ncbi:hypothetical protein NIES2100_35110 [Calothrix sp. NIES-2100]|uniref:hypothetical protein n=1 Tax=Calothrix sp. NIES-2100 TaxID=1954172 RepID=UPI000B612AAA|nr:hypothetical protein NIES2100_35110 [Calothrix sp. NIES-2100]